jgi:hypothetical protein
MKGVWIPWAVALLAAGCTPDFDDRESIMKGPRILAVRGDPPEVRPGESATYTALLAGPDGTLDGAGTQWAFCAAPMPLTENGPVSSACLGDAVRPLGDAAPSVSAATPADACALFGPDTPPGDFRPRDPDSTGGFYQPVRVEALGRVAFGLERITCNLPNAPLEAAVELAQRYHANKNPALLPLVATVRGAPVALDGIPAGEDVRFEVGWKGEDAEGFPAFDPKLQAVIDRREALRVFWYATAGAFQTDVTGRSEAETETSVSNAWRAPAQATRVFLWLVLRDSRGGVDFASYELSVGAP